jgi:hypothetical protein
MTITSTWCSVLQATVSRRMTFEGDVSTVICPEFDAVSRTCRLKKAVCLGGPLSQLIERVSEGTLSDPAPRCNLA